MTRLLVHVEGQTEETFVNEALAPHLYRFGMTRVGARLIGNARQRSRRGGIKPWSAARNDIVAHLREDQECIATTMVDYYGMPKAGSRAWPGRSQAAGLAFPRKAKRIEDGLSADIQQTMGSGFDDRRFIPYVMMHEFEAMLFSDCERFGESIGRPQLAPAVPGDSRSIRHSRGNRRFSEHSALPSYLGTRSRLPEAVDGQCGGAGNRVRQNPF